MSVLFCGENPGFTLFHPQSNAANAVVSYWMSRDSIFGRGSALVVHTSECQAVLTKHPELAAGLNFRFTQHFPEFKSCGVPDRILSAQLTETWDSDGLTVKAHAASLEIEACWSRVLGRRIVTWSDFPGTDCDLSNVFMPCATAWLKVNGVKVEGTPKVEGKRSSAFLALSEVWVESQPISGADTRQHRKSAPDSSD
jgi:hypothetical protein